MNTELTASLERIKAECREAIELAKNETLPSAPWTTDTAHGVMDKQNYPVCYPLGSKKEEIATAAFIATSRTITPKAAQGLLTAIDGLEKAHTRTCLTHAMKEAALWTAFCDDLKTICDEWEGKE